MPYTPAPTTVPRAPINDALLEALIRVFEYDPDQPLTESEASLMFQATPGCLRELLAYRRLLAERFAEIWPANDLACGNVISLAAARRLAAEAADPGAGGVA